MVEPVRHRQTKGAGTAMLDLRPPRHTSTLHKRRDLIRRAHLVPPQLFTTLQGKLSYSLRLLLNASRPDARPLGRVPGCNRN